MLKVRIDDISININHSNFRRNSFYYDDNRVTANVCIEVIDGDIHREILSPLTGTEYVIMKKTDYDEILQKQNKKLIFSDEIFSDENFFDFLEI